MSTPLIPSPIKIVQANPFCHPHPPQSHIHIKKLAESKANLYLEF
jgi:hypothetical protein